MGDERVGKGITYILLSDKGNEIAWFRLGMWKLRGLRKGVERGRCPLCEVEQNQSHVLPKDEKMEKTLFQQKNS